MINHAIKPVLQLLSSYDPNSQDQAHHLWMSSEILKHLSNEELDAGTKTYLRFKMAIALDVGGKHLDALEVFHEVLRAEPNNVDFQHSMTVIQARVVTLAESIYRENEDSPLILNYHEILNAHQYSPFWLSFCAARQMAKAGKHAEAKTLCQSVHDVSPNDPDSFRECLRVARISNDRAWERSLVGRLEEIRERRPHDSRYADIT